MVKLFCAVVGVGSVFAVDIDVHETVGDLKDKIKEKEGFGFPASKLKLYLAREGSDTWLNARHDAFQALKNGDIPDRIKSLLREELRLDETATLDDDDYFRSDFNPQNRQIHVLVELPDQSVADRPARSASTHSENRRKRWRDLNDIQDKNKKAKTNAEDDTSTGSSSVRWGEVKRVLDFEWYKQKRKPIPDATFTFLVDYLAYASGAMKGLFDDVKLEVDETVDGNDVHVTSHFEFVLTRGKKKICIVEAKQNDFPQATAQVLVGCEAVADRDGLVVVYGIVTDFMTWHLYRCGEHAIMRDSRAIGMTSDELHVDALRDVCEMVYGALADDDDECEQEKLVGVDVPAHQ